MAQADFLKRPQLACKLPMGKGQKIRRSEAKEALRLARVAEAASSQPAEKPWAWGLSPQQPQYQVSVETKEDHLQKDRVPLREQKDQSVARETEVQIRLLLDTVEAKNNELEEENQLLKEELNLSQEQLSQTAAQLRQKSDRGRKLQQLEQLEERCKKENEKAESYKKDLEQLKESSESKDRIIRLLQQKNEQLEKKVEDVSKLKERQKKLEKKEQKAEQTNMELKHLEMEVKAAKIEKKKVKEELDLEKKALEEFLQHHGSGWPQALQSVKVKEALQVAIRELVDDKKEKAAAREELRRQLRELCRLKCGCPICYEARVEGQMQVLIPCGHLICKKCTSQMGISQGGSCPICRSEVEVYKIFCELKPWATA